MPEPPNIMTETMPNGLTYHYPNRNTWRHLFAGMAMQGMISHPLQGYAPESLARGALDYADALLNALEKGEDDE